MAGASRTRVKQLPMAEGTFPKGTKGKSWVTKIPSVAAKIYFFLIILQIPLFRVPCRAGMCSSPIHVTCSQLIASDIFPPFIVKLLLYPGAIVSGLLKNYSMPAWNDLFVIYNLTNTESGSPLADLHRLEVLVGSYFGVSGAFVGLLKPGRMSMFGTLLIVWGLVKEGIFGKQKNPDPSKGVYVYPTMVLALICAFSCVKYDMKKIMKSAPRQTAKPLLSSSKSKLG